MLDLKGKTILIAGFSVRSGAGAAKLLTSLGAYVRLWDEKLADKLADALALIGTSSGALLNINHSVPGFETDTRIRSQEEAHPLTAGFRAFRDKIAGLFRREKLVPVANMFFGEDAKDHAHALAGVDLIVLSPGLPLSHPLLKKARKRKIRIISEVELAYQYRPEARWVCITGTDGKTTTTTLTGLLFKSAGKKIIVAGNIGRSLCEAVLEHKHPEYIIAELSSFQLETIDTLRPFIAMILNITPDHLDRYPSFGAYARTKYRITMNQGRGDFLIVNGQDSTTAGLIKHKKPKARVIMFDRTRELKEGAYIRDNMMVMSLGKQASLITDAGSVRLKGEHNKENMLAALAAAKCAGISDRTIARVLRTFRGVEHRAEEFRELKQRLFVNDSKATTLNAVRMALLGCTRPVILLMGGRAKGDDFSRIAQLVKEKARVLILFGEAGPGISRKIKKPAGIVVPCLSDAVAKAWELSLEGDVILLSPGCTSYDEFRNFEERGKYFKDLVRRLK
jgi:UDP-N-acetylmuramoylalanine--D-glutamate ligase